MNIRLLVISDYRSFHTVRPEAEIFIGLAKAGYDISIMTYPNCRYSEEFTKAGIHVIPFHPQKKFNYTEVKTIREYLINKDIQVLHLFNSKAIINGIRAAKNLPVKVCLYRGTVANVHWYDPSMYLKYLNPRVDRIICNSRGVMKRFHKQLFFPKYKAVTINKGHDLSWYKDIKAVDVRKQYSLPDNSMVLVSVANNRRVKGVPYLLKAINLLPENLPIHLLLIGRNMENKENLAILSSGKNKNKVRFLGFQEEALPIVKGADVFVLSSLFGESITKSVIEAMATEVPPIITNLVGNQELCEDKVSGLVVPTKDPLSMKEAILRFYHDRSLIKTMGAKAKIHIEKNLNINQTIKAYQELHKELLS